MPVALVCHLVFLCYVVHTSPFIKAWNTSTEQKCLILLQETYRTLECEFCTVNLHLFQPKLISPCNLVLSLNLFWPWSLTWLHFKISKYSCINLKAGIKILLEKIVFIRKHILKPQWKGNPLRACAGRLQDYKRYPETALHWQWRGICWWEMKRKEERRGRKEDNRRLQLQFWILQRNLGTGLS